MRNRFAFRASAAALLVMSLFPPTGFAQEKAEGTVVSTRLTSCEFKPGGCEGELVLERKGTGKAEQMTIKVPKGTLIKKGNDVVYLPTLRGNQVAVTFVLEKGEAVAKSIDVLKASRP